MTRRLLTAAAAVAGLVSAAAAQDPANVMTMKTAGQPDRKVQILKSERAPDGRVLTEVKDLASGEVYTILDVAPGGTVDNTTPMKPTGTPAAVPAAVPAKPVVPSLFGKAAKPAEMPKVSAELPRSADPLLGTPAAKSVPQAKPVMTATPVAEKPGFLTRVFGGKTETPAQKPVFRPAAAPVVTAPAKPATAIPPMVNKPVPAAAKPPATAPAAPKMIDAPKMAAAPKMIDAPKMVAVPVAPPALTVPVISAGGSDAPALPKSTDTTPIQITLPVGVVAPLAAMRAETADAVEQLQTHVRPSYRMEAATALADGRYGSQEATKLVLAESAAKDPAGAVRGHCIECLSKLGYADAGYVANLQKWASDDEPAVRRAAVAAAAKLMPK